MSKQGKQNTGLVIYVLWFIFLVTFCAYYALGWYANSCEELKLSPIYSIGASPMRCVTND